MTSSKGRTDDTANDQDAAKRNFINQQKKFKQLYQSQHRGPEDASSIMANETLDMIGLKGVKAIAPTYKSGINPNFFDEYFSKIEKNDLTNTLECQAIVWSEYQSRRWSYATHLSGYHEGIT